MTPRGTSRKVAGTQNSGRGHWNHVALGGRDGLTRRNWIDRGTVRRLLPGGMWVPPGGLDRVEDFTPLWMKRCFDGAQLQVQLVLG